MRQSPGYPKFGPLKLLKTRQNTKQKINKTIYIKKKDRIELLKHLMQNIIDGIIDKPNISSFWNKIAEGWEAYQPKESNEKPYEII